MKRERTLSMLIVLIVVALSVVAFGAMNFVRDSGTVQYTNTGADINSGDLVDLAGRYGVALADIASNGTGIVKMDGIFDLRLSATGVAVTVGANIYYNSATNVTTTAASNTYVGQAVEAISAATSIKLVEVDLNVVDRSIPAEMSD